MTSTTVRRGCVTVTLVATRKGATITLSHKDHDRIHQVELGPMGRRKDFAHAYAELLAVVDKVATGFDGLGSWPTDDEFDAGIFGAMIEGDR